MKQPEAGPGFIFIARAEAERDAKLRAEGNNGRKICATSLMPEIGETEIRDARWTPPNVLVTGEGGFEIATASGLSTQDRHKHLKGTEIYTVLEGEMRILIDDEGPFALGAGDEIVILPGTVHEVLRRPEVPLLVRVHALNCEGARDKYVQLAAGGEWRRWSELRAEERRQAYRVGPLP